MQFFKAFKQCNKVGVENMSCLTLRLLRPSAPTQTRFAGAERIMDFENEMLPHITWSHLKEQVLRATENGCAQSSVSVPFIGVTG